MSGIAVDKRRLDALCRRWWIDELALFGSYLRGDNTSKSDVDLLVTFNPQAQWSLYDFVELQEELSSLLERKVDLVSRRGLERSR
ncbi:MAG: nucleotidyltransferase domain-containing protein, partial [bacterium]|nr:nucleotidyltransferase domain-containing protein [bacterium]